jgi:predicted transcriptional regulator
MQSNILLISIRPKYATKIFYENTKNVELRRVRTRLQSGDLVLVYVSYPEKALLGSFEVERVIVENLPKSLNKLWNQVENKAGIKRKEFDRYYEGASVGVGIFFNQVKIFPQRLELERLRKQLPNLRPPQSYRYMTDGELEKVNSLVQCKAATIPEN